MLLQNIETLLNRMLSLDPYIRRQLSALAGRQVRIEMTDLELAVIVLITAEGLELHRDDGRQCDVTISGRTVALLGLLINRQSARIQPGKVELKGDVQFAQEFQALLKGLEIDWEEYTSRWIGDTAARKLGNFTRNRRNWLRQAQEDIRADISEYLRFEIELLPDRLLIDEFNTGVDILRDDAERLQQRIARLQQRNAGGTG